MSIDKKELKKDFTKLRYSVNSVEKAIKDCGSKDHASFILGQLGVKITLNYILDSLNYLEYKLTNGE
jgi:hypothetical protein